MFIKTFKRLNNSSKLQKGFSSCINSIFMKSLYNVYAMARQFSTSVFSPTNEEFKILHLITLKSYDCKSFPAGWEHN